MPALEKIWADSKGQSLADFNFRTVTSKFNELVYQYPIRIPERYSLVIRSLLTQVRAACVYRVASVRCPYVTTGTMHNVRTQRPYRTYLMHCPRTSAAWAMQDGVGK